MGISVDVFVKTYKATSKAKDKTFEDFIAKHMTTTYIPYLTKVAYCQDIVEKTSHRVIGENRNFVTVNSPNRHLFFTMKLIELYTDIEFNTYEKVDKDNNISIDYDKLKECGAAPVLISAIPEEEFDEFTTILTMVIDDFYQNEYSLTALAYNAKESLSLSEEVINSVIDDLTKQAE